MTVSKESFGCTTAGLPVDRFTIANGSIELKALTYGGVIQSLAVPGSAGDCADVVLGFDSLGAYERSSPYFGAIIGRYANRLSHARFTLDGVTYQLAANDRLHHLHGGARGFDKEVWDAEPIELPGHVGVTFSRMSRPASRVILAISQCKSRTR